MAKNKPNQLRIIGGRFRGRKISFPNVEDIRPTPDRVRETLFNWLQPYTHNAVCLDLFTGSGALGLEALSRGASYVHFYDSTRQVVQHLKQILQLLSVEHAHVSEAILPAELAIAQKSIDIVFLDPPFRKGLAETCLTWLIQSNYLKPNALIYLETEKDLQISFPPQVEILKEKVAGQVCYKLLHIL